MKRALMCLFFAVGAICMVNSCNTKSSSQQQATTNVKGKYQNLVGVNPPSEVEAVPSKIYVDSVRIISYKDENALLISGNFANSCTSIKQVKYSVQNDILSITLKGWKPARKVCAAVLTPFSYIFKDLKANAGSRYKKVRVNDSVFKLEE